MCFGPDQPPNWSDFLKNGDWLGRKWQGWSINQCMIPLPVFVKLYYELILSFKWCNTSLQPYTHVFWASIATQLVHFDPELRLALQKMVRLDWEIIPDSNPMLHEPLLINQRGA